MLEFDELLFELELLALLDFESLLELLLFELPELLLEFELLALLEFEDFESVAAAELSVLPELLVSVVACWLSDVELPLLAVVAAAAPEALASTSEPPSSVQSLQPRVLPASKASETVPCTISAECEMCEQSGLKWYTEPPSVQ